MKMTLFKDVIKRCGGAAAIALLAAGVVASGSAAAAATGIAGTKHNLGSTQTGSTGTVAFNKTSATGEICVFCHTPHGSDTGAAIPLWNKTHLTAPTYATYQSLGSASLDGGTAPVGSTSLACLSCHDGSQAMSVMINQPGSGGYNAAGGVFDTAGFTGSTQTAGKLSSGIAYIGVDLTNDHPVGIQYAGGPGTATTVPVVTGPGTYDKNMFKDGDFKTARTGLINSKPVWWLDTDAVVATGTREKTDILLYTRPIGTTLTTPSGGTTTTTDAQPFVECASCHDPHSSNPTFLRVENAGSKVCLACHDK